MAVSEPYFPPPPSGAAKQTILVSSTADPTPEDLKLQARWRVVDGLRSGITTLSLAAAFVVVVISAQALHVYNSTHVGPEMHLPLWPAAFDIRPTVSLVVCSTLISIFGAASLLAGKCIRKDTVLFKAVAVGSPLIAFINALVAMSHSYGVNSSNSVDTLMTWSCRWRQVSMLQEPHFGTLCEQSKAGLNLTVLLVPLQLIVLSLAAYQIILDKKLAQKTVFLSIRRTDTPESMTMA